MKLQQLLSYTRRAVDDFKMIQEGDKIAVGISGGKDILALLYVNEADIIGFQHKYQLPVCKSPCPADGHTRREYAKNLLKEINQEAPGVRERMFRAVLNGVYRDRLKT